MLNSWSPLPNEVDVVPVVAQAYLALLAVTSGATQRFSCAVDRAVLVQCVLPFTQGQFERSSSRAENSLTLQRSSILSTCEDREEGDWETPRA